MTIDLSDKDGFTEITKDLEGDSIDLLIHSPGGSAEAVESIVEFLREKYKNLRVIVSGVAKSAATIMAFAADEIVMTRSSELGPIDPQIKVRNRYSPAGSIKEQFEKAVESIKEDPKALPAWIPILQEYAPSLLIECDNYIELAERLVKTWMKKYMFNNEKSMQPKIEKIARYLTNEKESLSHARRIGYDKLKELGVKVTLDTDLGEDFASGLHDVHLVLTQTLTFSDAVKIFENSNDKALVLNVSQRIPIPNQPIN
jgi:hypothetical protein